MDRFQRYAAISTYLQVIDNSPTLYHFFSFIQRNKATFEFIIIT